MAIHEIELRQRYLVLPVQNGAPRRHMQLAVRGQVVRAFEIELAEGAPDLYVYTELGAWVGERLTIEAEDVDAATLEQIGQAEQIGAPQQLYQERLRPQFHFTSKCGWNNDPNGLLYYRGEYHLFYQHQPYGWRWGNMHWGHAISRDLVHWEELGDALYPDRLGTCFSGSGVVDWENTAGFRSGTEKALICIYTSAGGTSRESEGQPFTQSLAYSNDCGRTWERFVGNPVLGHLTGQNRDPKVIWHAPTRQWIMVLYLDEYEYALLGSADLKAWTRLQDLTLPGATECPDFFPLAVDGDPRDVRWVFWGANGTYLIGRFDGQTFEPEGAALRYDWGGNSYAAQTWSDIPDTDGRRIQIAWLRVDLPGMPFNQCMTFPCTLTLRTTPDGVRLCSEPVREIERLYGRTHTWSDWTPAAGETPLPEVSGELWALRGVFEVGEQGTFGFLVRGVPVTYDVGQGQLTCMERSMPLPPVKGRIQLQVLVDRASIEIFGNEGLVALPMGVLFAEEERGLKLLSGDGTTRVKSLQVHELRSAWKSA